MVCHYPEDEASYWKVGQHPLNFFTLSLRPDPTEELRLLEEKAAATYGVYKEKCDTKVSVLLYPSYWNFLPSLCVCVVKAAKLELHSFHNRLDFLLRTI